VIKVDNSHRTRLFTNASSDEIDDLKSRVANKILEIESGSRDYNKLAMFENESYKDNISVFLYKKKIDEAIKLLLDEVADKAFKNELRNLQKNLFKVLIGDFKTIKEYLIELDSSNSKLIHRDSTTKSADFKKYQKRFEDLYTSQLSGSDEFKKSFFRLFTEQGINVCPYCNRNYINPIYKTEKVGNDYKKKSPDIEHFFPKSIYPLFSLAISNLLPSCDFCNKIKSNVDTYPNCKSPYEIEEDDFKFYFDPLDVSSSTIKLESKFDNSKILHLENLYAKVHNKFVDEIYLESRKYPLENRRFLNRFFSLPLDSQKRLYKRKMCNYYLEDDFNKQPLSKMTKDLFMQIKEDEE